MRSRCPRPGRWIHGRWRTSPTDWSASASGSRAGAVERVLTGCLRDLLGQAWRRGWEPVDLDRFVGRRHRAVDRAFLIDCMADELGRHAAATVDPRWHGQLEELDAGVWWPKDSTLLRARATEGSWPAVLQAAVQVLHLLGGLPALEVLGPAPGEYHAPRRAQAPVDERILSRVRALLAKAESTTFEAEAETFTAGAQALMARHSIDAALLSASGRQDRQAPTARRIGLEAPYETPKVHLLTQVADANRCRTVWSKELGFVTVVGFAADLDAVETLFTSLLVQSTRAMRQEGSRTYADGASRTRSFRRSFLLAFGQRIGERLRQATDDVLEEMTAQGTGPSYHRPDTALVPVLAERAREVDDATDLMFPQVRRSTASAGTDPEGWQSGRRAADRAALDRGAHLSRAMR